MTDNHKTEIKSQPKGRYVSRNRTREYRDELCFHPMPKVQLGYKQIFLNVEHCTSGYKMESRREIAKTNVFNTINKKDF